MSTLVQRWMGRGNTIKESYTFKDKLAGFVDITRPILSLMGALGVAAAAAFAYGGIPEWKQCLLGIFAAFITFAGIHTFNDYVDSRRDLNCWPGRPIPSRRVVTNQALILAVSSFILALIIIWLMFNLVCFAVCSISIILGCLYSAYLRDRIGYLVLPPIQSLLWLCGWTAFSPDTLFSSELPWVLYLFSVIWQSGHIMIYSPLHPIRKVKGEKLTQVPALFVTTSPKTAATMGFAFFLITLLLAIFLGFYARLGLLFVIPVGIMGVFTSILTFKFMRDAENFSDGIKAFQAVTYFMLVARILMLLSIFLFV